MGDRMGDCVEDTSTKYNDIDMTPIHNEFTGGSATQQVIEKWNEKMKQNLLAAPHFKEFWRVWVPRVYKFPLNTNCLDWHFDEENAQKILFSTLEEFICDGNLQEVFAKMQQFNKPSAVCGRVFKMGEPTYSCKECGMDATCVLCVDCFKQSSHRNHKYKMGTSSGGGCCDCGDDEAWKNEPYCDIHIIGKNAKKDDETEDNLGLTTDVVERAKIVFDAVLWYAFNLLTLEHSPNLPADLQLRDSERNEPLEFIEDTFCTILYNDETHTFEQVISTLARVLKCEQRDAIEFVTNIDREGRSVVKCSTFHHCTELKSEIEKYTSRHGNRPLKVSVVHSDVVAHQYFAIKLLQWLPTLLRSEAFRNIFTKVFTKTALVEGVLLRDCQMWKAARTYWHRLLISGMLMEYESKKTLAIIFTKNYGHILKDFIRDDHDHSFSVSSLSVQLFTVPTLAHFLISKHDVLFILLNTFISECARKCNKQNKLEFERNVPTTTFKRAQFILFDIRYLLSSKPKEWTDELRKRFLQGLGLILDLLQMMQGMDSVSRQVGQHMEYEPEWESAFNLHIKLAAVITLVLEWCGSDRIVLIKAYKATLKRLQSKPEEGRVCELANHSATSLTYDVATQPVSIHLPLSRFLAGLHLYLEQYNLTFDEFKIPITPVEIMEPVLRTQVMIAQVYANMWRRNGYALLNQLYFYNNVKCRSEMYDRDIQLLQIVASLIESNEFMIHLISKFWLMQWAGDDFEEVSLKPKTEDDSMRMVINIVEGFLGLLITIIGERYVPGIGKVTVEERLKKEIIQQLCIKSLPRSEINKTTTIDDDFQLDDIINEVATFKKPPGVYELKPQYYKHYNVFFYHYTREELSKSEENQRLRLKQTTNQPVCTPPPPLPELHESFSIITNLLQCDVMLHVMQLVLQRCNNLRARSYSETQLHKVLHLIGYALQEQESQNYPFFQFTERAKGLVPLMEQLVDSSRIESHKELLVWVLNKFKQVSGDEEKKEMKLEAKDNSEKEWRAKMAAERRAKLMAQMQTMQSNFMKEHAKLWEETAQNESESGEVEESDEMMDLETDLPICLGLKQTSRQNIEKRYTCISCQEQELLTSGELVLCGFVQQSTVLLQQRNIDLKTTDFLLNSNFGPAIYVSTCGHVMHSKCWRKYYDLILHKESRRPYRSRHPTSFDVDKSEYLCPLCCSLSNTIIPLLPPLGTLHEHQNDSEITFKEWCQSMQVVLNAKLKVSHNVVKCNIERCTELHCHCQRNTENNPCTSVESEPEICDCISHEVYYACPLEHISQQLHPAFPKLFPKNLKRLTTNITEMIESFSQTIHTLSGVTNKPGDAQTPLHTWKSCAYTIRTIECLLRDDKSLLGDLSSRQKDCLASLIRICAVNGSIWKSKIDILKLLSMVLENGIGDYDEFGLLVALSMNLPNLYEGGGIATGGQMDHHLTRLLLLAHLVKIIGTVKDDFVDDFGEGGTLGQILQITGKKLSWKTIEDHSLPFLRCCVLFYHFLTDVPSPETLTQIGGDTFSNMLQYLNLPTDPNELLSPILDLNLLQLWNYPSNFNIIPDARLITLPHDYSELINTVSLFTCPNSGREDSRNPTMCLICGEMLCSQSYCCQQELSNVLVGACTYHAYKCGGGSGLFLRIRECEIMFLASPFRGCLAPPPYLDDYGETDQGLRRGNPLRLCQEKYKQLQNLWLGHRLHDEIARSTDANNTFSVATQWQHL